MANNFIDIHNMLVEQMRVLSDKNLSKDLNRLEAESEKAKALCGLSSQIVSLTGVQLRALELKEEYGLMFNDLPGQIDAGNSDITFKRK